VGGAGNPFGLDAFDLEGPSGPDAHPFPGGAALLLDGRGWVLVDGDGATSVGRALAWAQRHDLDELHLLVADGAGVAARRAALFASPPQVWAIDGRALVAAVADPPPTALAPPAEALDLVGVLAEAGVEIVVEHGVVRGEVMGLEVARVVVGDDGAAQIEVGVGRHDREAFAMLHGHLAPRDALVRVAADVRAQRTAGGPAHPLRSLAPERLVRHRLVAEPALVGAASLEPAEPTLARDDLRDVATAVAVGVDADGSRLVVACSSGVDLDLVPAAADARAAHAPGARLVLALAPRDALPVTRRLAAALAEPAQVVELDAAGGSRAGR
jgi:hypothetical protein